MNTEILYSKAIAVPALERRGFVLVVNATYQVIDVLQDALVKLAGYYPPRHFETDNPKDYFSELISTRFRWHRYHHEPDGHGKNGTIVNTLVAGSTLDDVERMVTDMVTSLTLDWSAPCDWRSEWDTAKMNGFSSG